MVNIIISWSWTQVQSPIPPQLITGRFNVRHQNRLFSSSFFAFRSDFLTSTPPSRSSEGAAAQQWSIQPTPVSSPSTQVVPLAIGNASEWFFIQASPNLYKLQRSAFSGPHGKLHFWCSDNLCSCLRCFATCLTHWNWWENIRCLSQFDPSNVSNEHFFLFSDLHGE